MAKFSELLKGGTEKKETFDFQKEIKKAVEASKKPVPKTQASTAKKKETIKEAELDKKKAPKPVEKPKPVERPKTMSYEESKYKAMTDKEAAKIASPVLGALGSIGFKGGKEGEEIKKQEPLLYNIGTGVGLVAGGIGTTALAKKALSGVALSNVVRTAAEGAVSGGLLGGTTTALQGGSQKDVLKGAATGAALGAVGDVALTKGLALGDKALKKGATSFSELVGKQKPIAEALEEVIPAKAPDVDLPVKNTTDISEKLVPKKPLVRGTEQLKSKLPVAEYEQGVSLKYNPVTDDFEEVLTPITKAKETKSIKDVLESVRAEKITPVEQNIIEPVKLPKTKKVKATEAIPSKVETAVKEKITIPQNEINDILNSFKPPAKVAADTAEKVTIPEAPVGQKVRGFAENIMTDVESPIGLRKEVAKAEDIFYDPLANDAVHQQALERFNKGFDAAYDDFYKNIEKLDPSNVVLAKLLARQADLQGNPAMGKKIIVDISEKLTNAGQFSNAAKILRVADSPSALQGLLDKQLAKINTQGLKRYGNKWTEIKLTADEEALINSFKGMDDANKDKIMEQLYNSIQSRIPVTLLEKMNTWRRISMLLNPKTQVRNFAGNMLMKSMTKASDVMATGLEKAFVPSNMRTKSLTVNKQLKPILESSWESVKSDLAKVSKFDIEGINLPALESDKRIFKNKALNSLDKVTKQIMEKGDEYFLKSEFENSLGQFMTARNISTPTDEAIEYAKKRALEQTFRNKNAFSQFINNQKQSGTVKNVLLESIIPFSKTPSNIVKKGVDFSPLGFIETAAMAQKSGVPLSEVINSFSQAATGTSLMGLGMYLASTGHARGARKASEKEEQLLQSQGKIERSFDIVLPFGDKTLVKNIQASQLQPAAFPFLAGVAIYESMQNKFDSPLEALTFIFQGLAQSAEDLPFIGDLQSMFSTETSFPEKVTNMPIDYMLQGIPTLFGQISQMADETKRTQVSDTQEQTIINKVKAKVGLTEDLPAKYDIYGEEIKRAANPLERSMEVFIQPFEKGKESEFIELSNEIKRVYDIIGSKDALPRVASQSLTYNNKEYTLTKAEKAEFQRIIGEKQKQRIQALFNSPVYTSASDQRKSDLLASILEQAYQDAKKTFVVEYSPKSKE